MRLVMSQEWTTAFLVRFVQPNRLTWMCEPPEGSRSWKLWEAARRKRIDAMLPGLRALRPEVAA